MRRQSAKRSRGVARRDLVFTPLYCVACRAPFDCTVHDILCPIPSRAAHDPTCSALHRPMPSCPRAGFASAWGHPRAQAGGRARGPDLAAPFGGIHSTRPRLSGGIQSLYPSRSARRDQAFVTIRGSPGALGPRHPEDAPAGAPSWASLRGTWQVFGLATRRARGRLRVARRRTRSLHARRLRRRGRRR